MKYYLKIDMKTVGIDKVLILDYAGVGICVVRSIACYYHGGAKEMAISKGKLLNQYREVTGDEAKMWFKDYYVEPGND